MRRKAPPIHDNMPATELTISGQDRSAFGGIVTIREQTTDRREVLHCEGKGWLERIVEDIDALEGDWRIVTISTPTTIYRDLQGTRAHPWTSSSQLPEPFMLGPLDRLDLLDPVQHHLSIARGKTHG